MKSCNCSYKFITISMIYNADVVNENLTTPEFRTQTSSAGNQFQTLTKHYL